MTTKSFLQELRESGILSIELNLFISDTVHTECEIWEQERNLSVKCFASLPSPTAQQLQAQSQGGNGSSFTAFTSLTTDNSWQEINSQLSFYYFDNR